MKAFINGIGAVITQVSSNSGTLLDHVVEKNEKMLQILPPEYKDFINPKELRRMSKIVRMGIVAAKTALDDSGVENPDAILTGTGMGCQADTEKFLNSMIDDKETLLNPTAFIQSTHNTTGAQIALMLGNNNYNFTYVHRTFSFESALLDSMLMLAEKEAENILLGGIDEITEESWLIRTKIGYFKSEPVSNLHLLADQQTGALAGEGAAFFILSSKKTNKSYACIKGVDTFFMPETSNDIEQKINSFLSKNNLQINDIDLVLSGYNGDTQFDSIYKTLEEKLFLENSIAFYKHICGEFDTSSAVAVWLAARILKENKIPAIILLKDRKKLPVKRILIYNQFRNINHSLILIENANL